ncbi:MAG: hypothetical protein CMQ61_07365 [Gammaproteobacteria bacterium]|nr:hypothetical protein [Gammaproteobacteria bacterium]
MTNIVLDIVGILMKLIGLDPFLGWTDFTPAQLKPRWIGSATVAAHELGEMQTSRGLNLDVREDWRVHHDARYARLTIRARDPV